jgi:SAM-dependent methyltransferase
MKTPRLSHNWDRHPDDYYIEPEWTSARLFEEHDFSGEIVDPACGSGRILIEAQRAGYEARGFDIEERANHGFEFRIRDFIVSEPYANIFDNVVSNPPFKHCDDASDYAFVRRALLAARDQVALLLPAAWLHGDKRGKWLRTTPLEFVYIITPRPSMPPGPVIEAGDKPGQGTKDFSWFVWRHGYEGEPKIRWLTKTS